MVSVLTGSMAVLLSVPVEETLLEWKLQFHFRSPTCHLRFPGWFLALLRVPPVPI